MGYLASHRNEGPILSKTISDDMGIPRNFLSKILHRLVQTGLINSIRGTKGGFVLAKNPEEISLRDVVGEFMRLDQYEKCFLGFKECDGSCGVHDRWKPIVHLITGLLDETSVDEMISKKEG